MTTSSLSIFHQLLIDHGHGKIFLKQKKKEISIVFIKALAETGAYGYDSNHISSIKKIVGYIPLLGFGMGVLHIVEGVTEGITLGRLSDQDSQKKGSYVSKMEDLSPQTFAAAAKTMALLSRGVSEVAGLGLFNLIIDYFCHYYA